MKTAKCLLIGLLLILLLAAPLSVLAQDDDKEGWVEYTASNELFTLSHPKDWFISYDPDDLLFFYLANSEEALEKLTSGGEMQPVSGDQAIAGFLMPAEVMPLLIDTEVPEDATPEALVELLAATLGTSSDDGDAPPQIGEPEVLELEDGLEAGIVTIQDAEDEVDGVLIVWEADGIYFIAAVATHAGEFDEEFQDLAIEIMTSIDLDTEAFLEIFNEMIGNTAGSSN
jgi:hypothetical protein